MYIILFPCFFFIEFSKQVLNLFFVGYAWFIFLVVFILHGLYFFVLNCVFQFSRSRTPSLNGSFRSYSPYNSLNRKVRHSLILLSSVLC